MPVGQKQLGAEMSGFVELMVAAAVVGFLGGFIAAAAFMAWAIWPTD